MIDLVLDHIWQSTLFVAAVGLLTFLLKSNNASVRYGMWITASLKFLFPLALLTAAGHIVSKVLLSPPPAPRFIQTLGGATQPFSGGVVFAVPAPVPVPVSWDWGLLLAAIWLLGFATVCAIWARHWLELRKIILSAIPSGIRAPLPVLFSPSQMEPGLVGVWSPVLLLPAGIGDHLSPDELEAIIAHEVCHLRRRDNLTAALHMAVEAIFWFYPLVWWLETRLIAERERACDEGVVTAGRDPQIYAESILKVCKFYVQSPLSCASGVSGADLKKRMEEIMWNSVKAALSLRMKLMLATAGATALAIPVLIGLAASPAAMAQTGARTTADPRSEAALRGQIEGFEKHQPAFVALASGGKYGGQYAMADFVRRNQAAFEQKIDALGALKSIAFRGVEYATDYYTVAFANGWLIAGIALTPDGKVGNLEFIVRSNPNGPEPGTEAAIRQITSELVKRQPPIDVLSPKLAQEMRVPGGWLSQIMPAVIVLGPLKSLTFQNVTIDGRDQYEAIYELGRASWTASPLDGGKMMNFGFRIGDPQNPTYAMAWNVGAEFY